MDFKQIYKKDNFFKFLKGFLPDDFETDQEELTSDYSFKFVDKVAKLGECKSLDLKVYEIDHKSENDPRVTLSKEAFRLMRSYASRRSLIIFKNTHTKNYRLSLITFQTSWDEGKNIKTEFSNPRRFSFYLGPDAKTKTPEKFLRDKVSDFDDLLSRFSVEVVNKEFYREIATYFRRLVGGDVKFGSKTEHFEPEMNLPSISINNNEIYQEFAVRLIGRIIFCWFLKQKNSRAGISLLPDEFLSMNAVKDNLNYYHNILEKIFFQVLNKPIGQRNPESTNGYGTIPYLNGGLFDPHREDFYENQPNWALKISDEWFQALFEILETYNFTIDENTVSDIDLSIDPEMLGRIFENLLAEINPETGESVRKSTGSYYTPRSIVEYMVDQSLIQYLFSETGINVDKIKALVSADESDDEHFLINNTEKHQIINALDTVKIIDPACGSGAFPIGILQKIVLMLSRIDQDGQLWFEKKTENIDPLLKEDFKKKFENENFDYIRKTGIIRDSIYGVDIQPIAVEVSKLRCFLTLIVDEDVDDHAENRGIKPLPNLEFKFVAANTLINLPGSVLEDKQMGIFEDNLEIEHLKKLRDQYFVSNGFEKERMKSKFKDIQREMFKKQIDKGGHGKMTMALAAWNPFSDESSSWFDSEWMYGVKHFDIVIANPPYGLINKKQNQKLGHKMSHKTLELYKNLEEYKPAIQGVINVYKLFILRSINLLTQNGCFVEIFPLSFIADSSCSNLRKHLLDNNWIIGIEAFPERDDPQKRVFEAVKMSVCILILQKSKPELYDFFLRQNSDRFIDFNSKPIFLSKKTIALIDSVNYALPLLSEREYIVLKKIYLNKMRMNEIGHCYTGEIDMTLCKKYITKDSSKAKMIKGAAVDRYQIKSKMSQGDIEFLNTDLYLKENHGGKSKHHKYSRIVMQGITGVNEKTRIKSSLIAPGIFCANSVNYFMLTRLDFQIKYLLGLINSNLMNYVFSKTSTNSNVNGYEVDNLPIVVGNKNIQDQIAYKVNQLLYNSGPQDDSLLEDINQMVYKLYDLTPEEIKIVEGENE